MVRARAKGGTAASRIIALCARFLLCSGRDRRGVRGGVSLMVTKRPMALPVSSFASSCAVHSKVSPGRAMPENTTSLSMVDFQPRSLGDFHLEIDLIQGGRQGRAGGRGRGQNIWAGTGAAGGGDGLCRQERTGVASASGSSSRSDTSPSTPTASSPRLTIPSTAVGDAGS